MKKNKDEEVVFYEISDFKYYLEDDKRASKNTISAYITDLNQYALFMKKYQNVFDVCDIERENILKYIASLKRKDLSTQSIARKVVAIKEFHMYLQKENITTNDPAKFIDAPKIEKHLPTVLSIDEIKKMINSISGDSPIDMRNKAMMETLYATGLRISELLDLRLSNIHFKEKYLQIIGKGNKERNVLIGEMALQSIRKYIKNAREKLNVNNTDLLFLNYKGDKMSRQGFYKYIVNLAKENGIEKEISPHTIRHSFATHLLGGGADIMVVKELLGHESVATTQIYTHIDNDELRDLYNNTHPLAKRKEEK